MSSMHPKSAVCCSILLVVLLSGAQACCFAATVSPEGQTDGRRLALVIGNGEYPGRPLRNPAHDAFSVSQALKRAGFEVWLTIDAGVSPMEEAVNSFVGEVGPGDVALFYYSGHGVLIHGATYLLPTDMDAAGTEEIRYRCHSAELVGARLANAGAALSIVIVDTCRDEGDWDAASAGPPPSGGRGDSCIIFSTLAGARALDSPAAEMSLFTRHLVAALGTPGKSLMELFMDVSDRVVESSGGSQQPVIYLTGRAAEFRFFPESEDGTVPNRK
jgi:uncharacterized caspase-like protein